MAKKNSVKDIMVSLIILNRNGFIHTDKCLFSIFGYLTQTKFEVILVDNGSSDGTVEKVRKKYPLVKIIAKKKNLGFVRGNWQGFKKAKGKYILILNNDTETKDDFLKPLVETLERDKTIGIIQPQIRMMIEPNRIDAVATYFTSTGFIYHFGYHKKITDNNLYTKPGPTFNAKGACLLTRREVINKIGLFDPDFGAYYEETDFCHRAWVAGYKVFYEPRAVIYHLGGADNKANPQAKIYYDSFYNRICSLLKNLELINIIKILPLHVFLCQILAVAKLVNGRADLFLALQKAIFFNLWHLPKTLLKRKKIQTKLRRVSDEKIFSLVKKEPRLSYYYYLFKGLENYHD